MGGHGVGNIMYKNLILLFKWWWHFSKLDNSLWKKILMSVHNIKGLKASADVFRNVKEGIWAQLLNCDVDTTKIRSIVDEGILFECMTGKFYSFLA